MVLWSEGMVDDIMQARPGVVLHFAASTDHMTVKNHILQVSVVMYVFKPSILAI